MRNVASNVLLLLLLITLLTTVAVPAWSQPPRRQRFGFKRREPSAEELQVLERYGKREARVHDPSSIVRCKGEYWLFATGQGVQSWRSKDLDEWERGPRVFDELPDWVAREVPGNRGHFWAPDVVFHNGRYLLYYSVSRFGVNTSAIALASNKTLDPQDEGYQWQDHGVVIRSRRGDNFNAIDPAVLRTKAGESGSDELWLSFGSFWSGIKLVKLDPETGKRDAAAPAVHSIAAKKEIEAPHIFEHDGYFYLFVNWGLCCRGVRSTYNVRVGRSRRVTGPYVDQEGRDLREGGGTLFLKTDSVFIGPGHANVMQDGDKFWFSCHYYDGTDRGRSYLSIIPLTFSSDGWPSIAPLSLQ